MLAIAPSWSWASVDGPVHFTLMSGFIDKSNREAAVVEECTVVLSTIDPFGQVSGGVLRLPGVVLDVLPKDLNANPNFYPDNETDSHARLAAFYRCVSIVVEKPWYGCHSAHSIILAHRDGDVYLRIGLLHCSAEEFRSMPWIHVSEKIAITVV